MFILPPPSPFGVVPSLPASLLPFMPSDQLLPAVPTFHHNYRHGWWWPPHYSSTAPLFTTTKQQIILHWSFVALLTHRHTNCRLSKESHISSLHCEINCLMTCILSDLAADWWGTINLSWNYRECLVISALSCLAMMQWMSENSIPFKNFAKGGRTVVRQRDATARHSNDNREIIWYIYLISLCSVPILL